MPGTSNVNVVQRHRSCARHARNPAILSISLVSRALAEGHLTISATISRATGATHTRKMGGIPSSQPLINLPTPISVTNGEPLYSGVKRDVRVSERRQSVRTLDTDRTRLEPNVEPLLAIVPT